MPVKNRFAELQEEITEWRRDLHAHPEILFDTHRTAALVADKLRDFGQSQVSLLLKPSGHVGGDLVGCFDGGNGTVAIYAIDVSGHGIASALLTARIAGYLTDGTPARNVAFEAVPGQGFIWILADRITPV